MDLLRKHSDHSFMTVILKNAWAFVDLDFCWVQLKDDLLVFALYKHPFFLVSLEARRHN